MSDPLQLLWLGGLGGAATVGALVGSFLNVVAWRLPAGRSVVYPPSACPRCGRQIRPWHNVPVLGWLMLRGRCADCGSAIAPRYPLVEAACGGLWMLLYVAMIPSAEALAAPAALPTVGLFAAYFSALLAISLIDADHFIVPDVISLPLIPLGICVVAILHAAGAAVASPWQSLLGAAIGGGVMWTIAFVGRLAFGREAMGMGDVKLVAAIGAWQGAWPTLLLTIFGASLLGSVIGLGAVAIRGRERPPKIPFGPWLCAGALISWVAGDLVMERWLLLM